MLINEKNLINEYNSILTALGFSYFKTSKDGYFGNYEIIYVQDKYFVSLVVSRGDFFVTFGFEYNKKPYSQPLILWEQLFSDNWKELSNYMFSGNVISKERYHMMIADYCPKIIELITETSYSEVKNKMDVFANKVSDYNVRLIFDS